MSPSKKKKNNQTNRLFVFINWAVCCTEASVGCWTVIFVPFGLESNDRKRSTKCLSLYMGTNQSSCLFCPFGSLFGHIIKMPVNEAGSFWMGAVLISCIGTHITASGLYWWPWFHKDLTSLRNDLILTDSTFLIFEVIQITYKFVDPHVCVSFWQHCTVSRFLKFLLCLSGFYLHHPPVMKHRERQFQISAG